MERLRKCVTATTGQKLADDADVKAKFEKPAEGPGAWVVDIRWRPARPTE